MHPFPHHYQVSIEAQPDGEATLTSEGLPPLATMPPPEFDGPGGYWSPESLLMAALAGCFTLSFRAVAKGSRLDWQSLTAEVHGTLERDGSVSRFTRIETRARLVLPAGADQARAKQLLEKAEKLCLISNSLQAERHLVAEVVGAG